MFQYWNQLPRCQRNLIILGISAMCITLLFLLQSEQLDLKQSVSGAVLPFRDAKDDLSLGALMRNKDANKEQGSIIEKNLFPYEDTNKAQSENEVSQLIESVFD